MRATGPVGQKTMSEDFEPRDILLYIGHGSDNAIGENLIKVPFMRAVREAFPCARVSWVHGSGESQFQSILKPLSGDLIDEILPEYTLEDSLGGILGWPALSQRRRFDLVIDTQKRPQRRSNSDVLPIRASFQLHGTIGSRTGDRRRASSIACV